MSIGKAVKIISDISFVTGLVVAVLFLVAHFTGKSPFQVFIVSSGSMSPAISTGSAVVVAPKPAYELGDIVSFSGATKKTTTTHRIVGVSEGGFRMAGDANDQPDSGTVPSDKIIGSVRFSVPYVGYLAAAAKTPQGFILLVIVPATIIIYEELKGLLIELKKILKKLKPSSLSLQRRGTEGEVLATTPEALHDSPSPRKFYLKPAVILPAFFATLISFSLSYSYFVDTETSVGNVLARGGLTPTGVPSPTPGNGGGPTPTPLPGEPFVDAVPAVSGTFGHCCSDLSSDPSVAAALITGAPDSPPDSDFIQISDSSVVVGRFVDNKAVDGPGADIRVHIFDTEFPATAEIFVSPDCSAYTSAGMYSDTADADIDLFILGLTEAQCVRVTDQTADGDPFPTLGFDVDAIEALNSVAVP